MAAGAARIQLALTEVLRLPLAQYRWEGGSKGLLPPTLALHQPCWDVLWRQALSRAHLYLKHSEVIQQGIGFLSWLACYLTDLLQATSSMDITLEWQESGARNQKEYFSALFLCILRARSRPSLSPPPLLADPVAIIASRKNITLTRAKFRNPEELQHQGSPSCKGSEPPGKHRKKSLKGTYMSKKMVFSKSWDLLEVGKTSALHSFPFLYNICRSSFREGVPKLSRTC